MSTSLPYELYLTIKLQVEQLLRERKKKRKEERKRERERGHPEVGL